MGWVYFLPFFQFWPLNCTFCQFTVLVCNLIILAVNWPKMHFNGQNLKKWRKQIPLIFYFTWKFGPQLFLGGPWAKKMTFSWNFACFWSSDKSSHNPWVLCGVRIQRENKPGIFFELQWTSASSMFYMLNVC